MIFKRGVKKNLITLRERKARYAIAIKNPNKTAKGTAVNIISTIKKLKKHIKTITFDQGSEFTQYQWIKDCLAAGTYFCYPGSPHQIRFVLSCLGLLISVNCSKKKLLQSHARLMTGR
jgi:IS30 family transposase